MAIKNNIEMYSVHNERKSVPSTYFISHLKGKEILGTFYEKELQKTNQKEFRIKKEIKEKSYKLYVKEKG